jgi:hypothetical protein
VKNDYNNYNCRAVDSSVLSGETITYKHFVCKRMTHVKLWQENILRYQWIFIFLPEFPSAFKQLVGLVFLPPGKKVW